MQYQADRAIRARRSPPPTSKKWGAVHIVDSLFKVYFRLRQLRLCSNLIRTVQNANLPPVEKFPASQSVTYKVESFNMGSVCVI